MTCFRSACISLVQCAIARTKPVEVKGKHVAILRRKLCRHHREFGGYFLVGIQTDDHPIARRERHEVVRPVCEVCVCIREREERERARGKEGARERARAGGCRGRE